MMPDRLEEIRQRAEKATPGPWETSRLQNGIVVVTMPYKNGHPGWVGAEWYGSSAEANAEFTAAARSDLPYLLRRLAAAEAVIPALIASPRLVGDPDGTIVAWQKAQEDKP